MSTSKSACSEHGVFCTFWIILTWKCASRHNGVHFFDMSTSKSACSEHGVCYTFWLGNVLRPTTACTFFDMSTSKSACSEHGVFCTVWLGNVLGAATACTFSFLIWPDGSAPAALASLLFDPPEPQIIGKTWKNTVFCDFATFSLTCIFCLLTVPLPWSSFFFSSSLWLFPPLLFICPYCWKFDF